MVKNITKELPDEVQQLRRINLQDKRKASDQNELELQ